MKTFIKIILSFSVFIHSTNAFAQKETLVGLSTDGFVHEIDLKTGALTQKGGEQITNFNLGGIARKKDLLYYIAVPGGSTTKAIYYLNLKTGFTNHADLSLEPAGNEIRSMFMKGKKLFAITLSSSGFAVYSIVPSTGKATLVSDQSLFGAEPVGGGYVKNGNDIQFLVKPEGQSDDRGLAKFTTKFSLEGSLSLISDSNGPVLCERIKLNSKNGMPVCLATNLNNTEVRICQIGKPGKTKCSNPLQNIERVAGGHTMVTSNGKDFYALVYEKGDQNSQRLIRFNAKGIIKSAVRIDKIFVGIRFSAEDDLVIPPVK